MINRKQFSKAISELNIGDKVIFTKSDGTDLSIKKINVLQYQVGGNTVSKTITNPQYELLLEDWPNEVW